MAGQARRFGNTPNLRRLGEKRSGTLLRALRVGGWGQLVELLLPEPSPARWVSAGTTPTIWAGAADHSQVRERPTQRQRRISRDVWRRCCRRRSTGCWPCRYCRRTGADRPRTRRYRRPGLTGRCRSAPGSCRVRSCCKWSRSSVRRPWRRRREPDCRTHTRSRCSRVVGLRQLLDDVDWLQRFRSLAQHHAGAHGWQWLGICNQHVGRRFRERRWVKRPF